MSESWDSTKVKRPQDGSLLPAPAAGVPAVYERAPTLMAGETAGSQGSVRVWSPSLKGLWLSTVGFGLGILAWIALIFLTRTGAAFSYWIGWMFIGFFFSITALRRPAYLTTDDAGIGITTRKGSRALRWNDIQSLTYVEGNVMSYGYPRILLNARGPVEINLTGYSLRQRGELKALILARAQLSAHPKTHGLYVCRNDPAFALARGFYPEKALQ